MNARFFCFLLLVALYDVSDGANVQWHKLNGQPVCFGARGDTFGSFAYRGKNLRASAFKLVYRSGLVSCNNADKSYWGCTPHHKHISIFLTDCKNSIIVPRHVTKRLSSSWYTLQGQTSSSPALLFPLGSKSSDQYPIFNTNGFRLWYGEDLYDSTEPDNSGRACADVHALVSV